MRLKRTPLGLPAERFDGRLHGRLERPQARSVLEESHPKNPWSAGARERPKASKAEERRVLPLDGLGER
jgi:hypothetical protein